MAYTYSQFESEKPLSNRDIELLQSISPFYDTATTTTYLVPLITQSSTVSLRALDWLCSNYSKTRSIAYEWDDPRFHKKPVFIHIHNAYNTQQKLLGRGRFDAFRRNDRLYFVSDNTRYETTLGQLCFLHFVYSTGIYKYAEDHMAEIVGDMKKAQAAPREQKKNSDKKVRRQLSKANTHSPCSVYPIKTSFVSLAGEEDGVIVEDGSEQ